MSSAGGPDRFARLRPSRDSALVIAVGLPPALDALRLQMLEDANEGVPPHVTLLYPFAEPEEIGADVVDTIAAIVGRHPALDVHLTERRRWPDTLYAAVEPPGPLAALQDELAAAFPSLPLYGGDHAFEPHVSIVEGPAAGAPDAIDHAAWATLPVTQDVRFVDLITKRYGRWAIRHRFAFASDIAGDGGQG
jgi:2'-5' RNA ligase